MPSFLSWLIHSEGGLLLRVTLGVLIFAALALADLKRNGSQARRWREYLFLLFCVVVALLYGILNDQLTVSLSWEYFYYGKSLDSVLGPQIPPAEFPLRWEAAKVGMKATWSAGLILGVVLLLANNPRKHSPALPFTRLYRLLPLLLLLPVLMAATLGLLGYLGGLTWANSDFPLLLKDNLWRPYHFMAVYGIHLGGYIGGGLAAILAAILIRLEQSTHPPVAQMR